MTGRTNGGVGAGRAGAPPAARLGIYLALGRVSNLPTVWTNTLAGVALAGGVFDGAIAARVALALSLLYVGGMFLNDAFDREIDARERPERPIPAGRITAAEVFGVGFGLLGAGLAVLAWNQVATEGSPRALVSGAALAGLIVLYDAWHKQNPFSPVVMGLCRAASYVTAALAAGGTLRPPLLLAASALAAYVVGLTFVARQENRRSYRAGATLALLSAPALLVLMHPLANPLGAGAPEPSGGLGVWGAPGVSGALVGRLLLGIWAGWVIAAVRPLFARGPVDVGRSVVRLIAGISLVDGLVLATGGAPELGPLGVLGLLATLSLQRWVRGT